MRQALYLGNTAGSQRTGKNHQTHVRHAQRCRARVCGPRKGTGDDANRGHPLGFSQNGVVETPRCAGASIRDAMNDGITLRHQRGECLLGAGSAVTKLGGVDYALDPVLLLEDFVQLL